MTSVELIGFGTGGLHALTGDRLKCRRGDDTDEVGDMRAAVGAAQQFLDAVTESGPDGHANEFFIVGRDLIAVSNVGHRVCGGFGIDDSQCAIDGNTQPHRMQRFSRLALPARNFEINVLRIVQVAFDIEQSIFSFVPSNGDVAKMQRLASTTGCGERHAVAMYEKKLALAQQKARHIARFLL